MIPLAPLNTYVQLAINPGIPLFNKLLFTLPVYRFAYM